MSEHYLDSFLSGGRNGGSILIEPSGFETARRGVTREDLASEDASMASALAQADREQLARDYADIARATAALRKGQPALESWSTPAKAVVRQPRPLWLLIGVLWFSTALVTVGAVVAIASFAG
jgi:hypothetical protein